MIKKAFSDSDFNHSFVCAELGGGKAGTSLPNNSVTPRMSHLPLFDAVWERGRYNPNPQQTLMTHSPVSCPIASTQVELWCSERRQSACRFSTALHPAAPAQTRREKDRFKGQREPHCITANSRKSSFLITAVSGEEGKNQVLYLYIFHISVPNDCLVLKSDLPEAYKSPDKQKKRKRISWKKNRIPR